GVVAAAEAGRLGGQAPAVPHSQARPARPEAPRLEELLQAPPRGLFQGPPQVARLDALPAVVVEVLRHGPPEHRFSQLVPQHLQDPGALVVDLAAVEAKDFFRVREVAVDHRLARLPRGRAGASPGPPPPPPPP